MDNIKLNEEISYLAGVIAGDGHLNRYVSKKRTDYKVEIFGDKENDLEYFQFLNDLFKKYFKLHPLIKNKKDSLCLSLNYKWVLDYFESIGIPVGSKCRTIKIPPFIKENRKLVFPFLRGLADTDFSITFTKAGRKKHSYPRITADLASKKMMKDIVEILERIGVTYSVYRRNRIRFGNNFIHYSIDIYGEENLKKWLECIGFSNIKHISKLQMRKKLGYCPPNTTCNERKNILARIS